MYSANYLFRTANVRWTMDPPRLKHKLPDALEMPLDDLKKLDFILQLIVQAKVDIVDDRLIVPEPMRTIEIHGVRIA